MSGLCICPARTAAAQFAEFRPVIATAASPFQRRRARGMVVLVARHRPSPTRCIAHTKFAQPFSAEHPWQEHGPLTGSCARPQRPTHPVITLEARAVPTQPLRACVHAHAQGGTSEGARNVDEWACSRKGPHLGKIVGSGFDPCRGPVRAPGHRKHRPAERMGRVWAFAQQGRQGAEDSAYPLWIEQADGVQDERGDRRYGASASDSTAHCNDCIILQCPSSLLAC